ncbi:MAG: 2-polyprenyl-6-methoxyphenol hydroxylase [Cyclobacteriaceae bacterium]
MRLLRIILILLVVASACTNDNEEDLFGEVTCRDDTSLADDVQPIIAANCAISGCHVSGTQLPNFSQKSTIINRAANIRNKTKDRTMPPPASGITLSAEEIQLIDCWVAQGANDN